MDERFDWTELPDIHDVRTALQRQAELKAQLKVAKLNLEIYQAHLAQQKPRDSSVKLNGIDEQSRIRLTQLFDAALALEAEVDKIEADVKFHNYRLEAARIMSYKGRA